MADSFSTRPDKAKGLVLPVLIATIIILLAATLPSANDFFSQDDFAGMNSEADNQTEFLHFFDADPERNRGWYRPLSFDIKFWIMKKLFGFNPAPHHMLPIILHCLNIVFLFHFLQKLSGRYDAPLLAAVIYGLSGAHQTSLYWISAGVEPITAFFFLSGLLLYLKWRESPSAEKGIGVCILFIVMLLCKEIAISFPFAILLIEFFFPLKTGKKKGYGLYASLFIILAAYLGFWMSIQYAPGIGGPQGYGLTWNPVKIGVNLLTYLVQVFIGNSIIYFGLQSMGAADPREFVTQLMQSGAGIVIGVLGVAAIVLFFILLRKRWIGFLPDQRSFVWFGMAWFVLGLLPVLPFPGHNTAYYLNIAMIGFSACIASVVLGLIRSGGKNGTGVGLMLLIIYIGNFSINTYLGATITPNAKRSEPARKAFEMMHAMHPEFEQGTLLFIINIDEEIRLTLNDGLIYMASYDDNLRWVFTIKEDQEITWKYLRDHGWDEGGPRIYYSYDGEKFLERDEGYFRLKYKPGEVSE